MVVAIPKSKRIHKCIRWQIETIIGIYQVQLTLRFCEDDIEKEMLIEHQMHRAIALFLG